MAATVTPIKPNKKIKPGAEYVSGSPYGIDQPRALHNIDDTELVKGRLSHELIDAMLTDPDVFAGLMLLALMALNEKLLIAPAITETVTVSTAPTEEQGADGAGTPDTDTPGADDKAPKNLPDTKPTEDAVETDSEADDDPDKDPERIKLAKEIADFCQRQIDRVPKFNTTMFEMVFEGMARGNKVAEQTLDVAQRGKDAGKWVLGKLKTKPRETVAFVVDAYMNEIGMLGAQPGQATVVTSSIMVNPDDVIPREKFAVFTYRPKNGNPLGTSALVAAVNGWELKKRTFPEYLLFLMVCAIPGILATLPPNADEMTVYEDDGVTPKRNSEGEIITVSAHQFLLNMLSQMRNHQVGVAPDGTNFTLLEANSEGESFTKGLNTFSKEITMAILFQQLATRDAEHQTKGSTGSQFRVIDLIVFWLRDTAADMVKYDIFKPLVRYNFGDDAAEELLPKCSYGDTEARDWSDNAQAAAALADKLTDSQWQHICNQLGIPAPTEAEQAFKRMAKQLMQQGQQAALNGNAGGAPSNNQENTDGDKQPADSGSDKKGNTATK